MMAVESHLWGQETTQQMVTLWQIKFFRIQLHLKMQHFKLCRKVVLIIVKGKIQLYQFTKPLSHLIVFMCHLLRPQISETKIHLYSHLNQKEDSIIIQLIRRIVYFLNIKSIVCNQWINHSKRHIKEILQEIPFNVNNKWLHLLIGTWNRKIHWPHQITRAVLP